MTDTTETGPARKGSTERCANAGCGHTKRDHSGRRDHTTKHPSIPLRPWCHACEEPCLYEPPASAVVPAADRAALRDRIAEDLRYVLDHRDPRHAHERPGVWDGSGKRCGHCARLAAARENLAAYDADSDVVLPAPADRAAILGEAPDLADRLEAVLTKRYTALGNPFSEMRRQEKGPDGWPASRPVGPHQVAEVLRELLDGGPRVAGEAQPGKDTETRVGRCSAVMMRRPHAPHGWEPQPGMDPVHCPGFTAEQQPKEA